MNTKERGPELRPDSPDDQFRDVWADVESGEWVHVEDYMAAQRWKIGKLRAHVTRLEQSRQRERAALMKIASRDVVDAADVAHRALQGETAP